MKKKMISLFLSVLLVLTMISALVPAVSADDEAAGSPERTIWVDDEFAAYGFNSDAERTTIFSGSPENGVNSYKNKISYDPASNTLTINNLGKDNDHCPLLRIYDMGEITLSVKGNSTLPHLGIYNTNLRIEGTGTLTLGTAYDLSAHEGHEDQTAFRYAVPVFAQNSRIQIAGDVTVKFDGDFCSIWYDFADEAATDSLLSWENEVSEEPVWDDDENNGQGHFEYKYDNTFHIQYKFPADALFALEGAEGDNYWIISNVGYEGGYGFFYSPLVYDSENGAWFEDFSQAYKYQNGKYYPMLPEGYVSDTPAEGISFTYQTAFDDIPETLVEGGYANAFVCKDVTSGGRLFEKDGKQYQLMVCHTTSDGGFMRNSLYNFRLIPVNLEYPSLPEGVIAQSEYLLLQIQTLPGGRKYLTMGESVGIAYDPYHVDLSVPYEEIAINAAKDLGYTPAQKWVADSFAYVLKNPSIAFVGHQHSLKKTNAAAATCEKAGNTAYYTCSGCGKYFSDKNGTKEIQKGSWKIPALGHSYKTVVLKKATTAEDGKIGSKCSRCGDVKTSKTVRKASKITLSKTAFVYNGKVQVPTVFVKDSKGTDIAEKYYTVSYSNKSSKNAGTYKIKVTLKGKYSGSKTLTYKIGKKANTITKVSPTKKTFKASVLKTKNQSLTLTATVKDNAATTYALTSVPKLAKNFIALTKAGKLTLIKDLPAGTYPVKVKITAAATTNYSAKTITTTITLTVK